MSGTCDISSYSREAVTIPRAGGLYWESVGIRKVGTLSLIPMSNIMFLCLMLCPLASYYRDRFTSVVVVP